MKIISYNVNGIRAALRKEFGLWLEAAQPDVICIQETKALKEQVETELFDHLGYQHYWHSAQKKGYSGVAILCKETPKHIEYGTGIDYIDFEGRVIRVDFEDISVLSVYVPSGTNKDRIDFKMQFCYDFLAYATQLKKEIPNLVICGDFNICHHEIDIHDPVRNKKNSGFLPIEREWLTDFIESGFTDSFRYLINEPHQYSWWSYRANARNNNKGWRIDYNMVSDSLQDKIKNVAILNQVKHSDHCPILVELSI